ncbi:MAG: M1 family metallopeptidase [bacterium]
MPNPRFSLVMLLVVGCGSAPSPAPDPAAELTAAGPDGNRRLDDAVAPTRYVLDLTVDPAKPTFSGTVAIDVRLRAPQAVIELHGRDLDVAAVTATVGGEVRDGRAVAGPNGGLAAVFAEPIPAGEATLRFTYTAKLPEVPDGLYRVKDGERWYAFSQFQPLYARQSFPGFDQPDFKTPYQTTLRVPSGLLAISNSRQVSKVDDGDLSVYTFAETKPLPTYLVAFAVGEFDVVEAPADAIPGTPLRIIATKGKGRLAEYALERTPLIHAALSAYFGGPHPFDKLDMVAVPNFAAGAMENVGLVTYRETLLLLDEETAPANRKMWSQSVIAHELAHMWFGNMVTLAWWDDLWLNEAFATWMAAKIVQEVDPELQMDLERVAGTTYVMELDAQKHARAIRQPIEHGGDVSNAFDGITYGKGAAVLRMLESWIGVEPFRDGVRAYLAEHAYGTATTADLMAALGEASKKPVAETARSFLDQPGTPLVGITVQCAAGKPATLALQQRRALPAGSDAPQGEPWTVPMCVRAVVGDAARRECFVFSGAQGSHTLAEPGCPTWIHGNDDQRGYYQWQTTPAGMVALAAEHYEALTEAERVALPGIYRGLLEAGEMPAGVYLDALGLLARRTQRLVVEGVVDGLGVLFQSVVVHAPALGEPFAAVVRGLLGPHVARIGPLPKADDPIDARLLRPRLVTPLAYMGRDPALRAMAREKALAWLDGKAELDGDVVQMVLPIAAWDGDAALWGRMRARLDEQPDPIDRVALVGALGSFGDPALATQSLDLILDGTLLAQDFRTLLGGIDHRTQDAAWMWMTRNYHKLAERMGDSYRPRLPWVGAGFCTAEDAERVRGFFSEPAHAPEGTERNLGLVLEKITRCARLREGIGAGLTERLTNTGKPAR